jgi:hypothetical protein
MEPNPEMRQTVREQQEVSKEEAMVRTSAALKKLHRGQYLSVQHCQKPKERT